MEKKYSKFIYNENNYEIVYSDHWKCYFLNYDLYNHTCSLSLKKDQKSKSIPELIELFKGLLIDHTKKFFNTDNYRIKYLQPIREENLKLLNA